ncbi:hypothetical protein D3C74_501180 [compost metagenome]
MAMRNTGTQKATATTPLRAKQPTKLMVVTMFRATSEGIEVDSAAMIATDNSNAVFFMVFSCLGWFCLA